MNRKVVFGSASFLVGIFLILSYFFWPQFVVSASFLEQFVGLKQLYIMMLVVFCVIALFIGPIFACLVLDTFLGCFNIKFHLFGAYLKLLSKLFHTANKILPSISIGQHKAMRVLFSFRNMICGLGLAIVLMLVKGSDEIIYLWIASYLIMKGLDAFGVLKAIEGKLFKRKP